MQLAGVNAQQREPAQERGGVQVGHVRLERHFWVVLRGGNVFQNGAEQWLERFAVGQRSIVGALEGGAAAFRRGIYDRNVEQRFGVNLDITVSVHIGREVEQEVEGFINDITDARIASIDLIHNQNYGQARG